VGIGAAGLGRRGAAGAAPKLQAVTHEVERGKPERGR